MNAEATTLRILVQPARRTWPSRPTVAAACFVIDVLATWILLSGTPLSPPAGGIAAAVLHMMAVLSLTASVPASSSRRWLVSAATLVLPLAGFGVAAVVLGARGRGSAKLEGDREAGRRVALSHSTAQGLADAVAQCDALDCGDEERRHAALRALTRRADTEAMLVLRRAAASGDPELALCAAMALDEIGEDAERRFTGPPEVAEVADAAVRG